MVTSSEPKPGDFRLVSIAGGVGRLIWFGQWLNGDGFTVFEHAAVYLGAGQFVQAMPGGAQLVTLPLDSPPPVRWSSGLVSLTAGQRSAIVTAACGYVGVGYSFADYDALAVHRLHIPAPGLKHFIADTGHMICSQLVDQCYQDAGVHLFRDGRWPGYVTPGALDRLLADAKR